MGLSVPRSESGRQNRVNRINVHVQDNTENGTWLKVSPLVGQTVPKAKVDIAAKYQGRVMNVYV